MAVKQTGLSIKIDAQKAIAGSKQVNKALKTIRVSARKTVTGISTGFSSLKKVLFSLRTAFLGIGITLLGKSFLDAAKKTEGFKIRLDALLGSVKESNKLFRDMIALAGRVPQTYEEIMESVTRLAGVVKGGAQEIKGLMPIILDLSAATGIAVTETTGQIIRMLSAGAAAADLFRERGVLQMLGFNAGVRVSVEETKRILMEAWNAPESKFRDVSLKLAKTWAGMTSMMADKWFVFRNMVMDSAPFEFLKAALKSVNKALADNVDAQKKFAQQIGTGLVEVAKKTLLGTASILDVMLPIISGIGKELDKLWQGFSNLPPFVQQVGIVGAFAFGTKGKLALATIAGFSFLDKKFSQYDDKGRAMVGVFNLVGQKVRDVFKGDESVLKFEVDKRSLLGDKKKIGEPVEVKSIFKTQEGAVDSYRSKVQEVIDALETMIVKEKEIAEDEALQDKLFPAKKAEHFFTKFKTGSDKALNDYANKITDVATQSEKLITNAFSKMEDSLVKFVMTGKFSFREFALSIMEDMARIAIRQAILGPLLGAFGFTGGVDPGVKGGKIAKGAQGLVIPAPRALAKGDVLHKPTLLAGGSALAGEAGAEGVLPLMRMRNGDLGVQAKGGGGSGSSIIINNNINVESGAGGKAEDRAEVAELISKQIEFMMNTKVMTILKDQIRPGGMLREEFSV